MYLLDTDTLSNLLKKNPSLSLLSRLSSLKRKHQFSTVITVTEMVYGAYKSSRPELVKSSRAFFGHSHDKG